MPRPRLTALLLALAAALTARADWKDDVGFTRLLQTFTSGVPNTVSSGLTQVEAGPPYMPNTADPQFSGKTFNNPGGNATISGHATSVALPFYGNTSSLIPATSVIDIYNANGWNLGATETRRVQNHSWIAIYDPLDPPPGGIENTVADINKSLDRNVNSRGFVSVVGVNNGNLSSTVLPDLLCQAYNTISVGLSNGNHSAGFTTRDGTGRIKPDLVAPDSFTSFSTPKVSSAAGLLVEKLTSPPYSLSGANIPRVTKALLLAGATKEEFPAWARTTARPLDLRYGAGELNILHAYNILLSGSVAPSNTLTSPHTAWTSESVRSSTNTSNRTYYFDIPAGSTGSRFSAALIWHRTVDAFLNATLFDLNLALYEVAPATFTLGTQLDASVSTVDNVEHLYQPNLAPGRYALQVSTTSGSSTAYALAWRTSPTVTVAATTAEASETNPAAPAVFTITRTGPTTTPLFVPLAAGGTAVSGTHYTALPSAVLIPAGSASATVSVVPVADNLAQGDRTVTLAVATDFSLSAGTPATATVTLRDKPYDAWRFARFTAPQLANVATSGPDSDPDTDGIPNLLEYAFAREPLTADSPAILPAATVGLDDRLTFTYFQSTDCPDLLFTPEWTADLAGPWQSSATYLNETARTPAPNGESVTVRAEENLTATPIQFFRLRVTRL